MKFKLFSNHKPTGDQPLAIKKIIENINNKIENQVLLGVTGSGKTFTIANVIQNQNRPTLILSHNKTLASQLYVEFKELFPKNRVEYFVSNFDYYRPEAYMPKTDTYIDKTSKSNWDLEAMRMSTLNALSTRRDTIVVASVAAIYGALNPTEYLQSFFPIEKGMSITRKDFIKKLVKINYSRNQSENIPGTFKAKGDIIELSPSWTDKYVLRLSFFDDEIEDIAKIDVLSKSIIQKYDNITIFPGDAYTMKEDTIAYSIKKIRKELEERLKYFRKNNKLLEAQRLEDRVNHDLESLEEFGICPGIENYARYMDRRKQGQKPYTLLDYFPDDAIFFIDESHMMIAQLNAMYNGDRARKQNLVDYGFRLPSALDNRPLKFSEFVEFHNQKIYVSATPGEYELSVSHGLVTNQIIRPTGLLEPQIDVISNDNLIENIMDKIKDQLNKKERTIILTTTIRTAEELTKFLQEKRIKVNYIHNELKTLQRSEILRKLRKGIIDVVIGINLLKEGIDLPEVSLVMVLDADKESFFRSTRALIQIVGRAARNKNGKVIFYGNKITKAMQETIDITNERRNYQKEYNKKHNIIPTTIIKPIPLPISTDGNKGALNLLLHNKKAKKKELEILIQDLRKQMLQASKAMNYERAAQLRDIILELKN